MAGMNGTTAMNGMPTTTNMPPASNGGRRNGP